MPTWTVKADRRKADRSQIIERLRSMEDTIEGLTLYEVDPQLLEMTDDERNFRDFAPVMHLSHDEVGALEVIAEELLLEFGWLIDLAPTA